MIERALLDNSAWARLGDRSLATERVEEVATALQDGEIRASLPFVLEAGYSARSARDHASLLAELRALPWAPIDGAVEQLALEAQRALARAGHHRLPPVDLLIAALAHRHGLGILHYDHDFDVISEKTSLSYASVWLAAPASLD